MKRILEDLRKQGIVARTVHPTHIVELKEELNQLMDSDPVIKENIGGYLNRMDYSLKTSGFEPKSILVIGVPDQITRMYFNFKGSRKSVVLPPTYLFNTSVAMEKNQPEILKVEQNINWILGSEGYHYEKINLPCKLMATRSGLAQYGRNNIAYLDGKSSFYWIGVYASDMPVQEDSWGTVELMESCQKCRLCEENCPTSAIPTDRYLIHAEKCLTLFNESGNAFPSWIKASNHNAIIGCMRCQAVCPKNKEVLRDLREGEEFSEEETLLILNTKEFENLPQNVKLKLERMNLAGDYEIVPRNLKVLIGKV